MLEYCVEHCMEYWMLVIGLPSLRLRCAVLFYGRGGAEAATRPVKTDHDVLRESFRYTTRCSIQYSVQYSTLYSSMYSTQYSLQEHILYTVLYALRGPSHHGGHMCCFRAHVATV